MDKRAKFLSRELSHALMFMAEFARNAVLGHANLLLFTPSCHKCGKTFNKIYVESDVPYMFMVVKSWLEADVDRVRFSCLSCKHDPVEDVIELYPSFSLANLKKLMYSGTLKRFAFGFRQPSKKRCQRVGVDAEQVSRALDELVAAKSDRTEIESVTLRDANDDDDKAVAQDSVYHLRVDWGSDISFGVPSQFTHQLSARTGPHYLEVITREYEEFQPFYVFFPHRLDTQCGACAKKVCVVKKQKKVSPVLFCEKCGFTSPNYWVGVYPFWLDRYDFRRTYWKLHKKVNLMLYDVDVSL
ncbi:ME53 [Betabaculovirus altermyunipunctae]|uniref:ME53 n=1 Tax=Betabaculovirus altermyunipunctae TaxID=3051996 RepID=A0A1S5YEE7_9BBAC|nr:ME53 [Betabaculovirus altermyunipunctae]AQQ80418.1 ME53 [Betabaculovirus altermyunipunctae]